MQRRTKRTAFGTKSARLSERLRGQLRVDFLVSQIFNESGQEFVPTVTDDSLILGHVHHAIR